MGVEDDGLTFGAAVELAVAMPLSWLPLVSDYTRTAEKPLAATAVSATVYGLISCWMYTIGMSITLFSGESDIAQIMIRTGLGAAGLIIIILSTVTTTFLDAHSAGISAEAIGAPFGVHVPGKWVAIVASVLGTIGAITLPLYDITNFLYLIGSVFAPMIAIMITDYFLLKNDSFERMVCWPNLAIWVLGFVLYRSFMSIDTPLGSTLPVMLVIMLVCFVVGIVRKKCGSNIK